MRNAILMFIVIGACVGSLHTPAVGLLGYIWFALTRPDILAYSPGVPYSLALAAATLISSLRHLISVPRLLANPIVVMVLFQQIPIGLSVVFAVRRNLAIYPYQLYLRMLLMAVLIPLLIDNERWLRRLYFVMVFSMGFSAVKTGLYALLFGLDRVAYGFGGYYADSNGLALALAVLIPLAIYGRELSSRYIVKIGCLGIAGMGFLTVVLTGSRGNLLAVCAVGLLIVWRSKHKIAALIVLALLAFPALFVAGNKLMDRMATVVNYEDDLTASSRLETWLAALKMSKDYPILGVGYGELNFKALSEQYIGHANRYVVHNTYLQTLVDIGFPGFVLYTATLFGTIFWLERSRRRMKKIKPEWAAYPAGLQTSLLGFAIGSTFYSRGDFEFAYFVLMTAAAWYWVEKQFLASLEEPARILTPVGEVSLSRAVAARVRTPQVVK